VYNNPVRHTDPSGHCPPGDDDCWAYEWIKAHKYNSGIGGGGDNDKPTPDEMVAELEESYGITLEVGEGRKESDWTPEKIEIVYATVVDMADTYFGGAEGFRNNVRLDQIKLTNPDVPPGAPALYHSGSKTIKLYDGDFFDKTVEDWKGLGFPAGTFADDRQALQFVLAHEIAHAFAGGRRGDRVVDFGVDHLFGFVKDRGFIEDDVPNRVLNSFVKDIPYPTYFAGSNPTITRHAGGWAPGSEAFADTLAAGLYAPGVLDQWQINFIENVLPKYVE